MANANSSSLSSKPFHPVRTELSLPKLEEEILEFWDKEKIFEKSTSQSKSSKNFNFYDGPPFATGLPHYGHLMAGTLKDIVPRYWTMKGFNVPRRFGWDCHGLPVEYEINKTHAFDSRKKIIEYGVGNYNALCKSIVKRYSTEWKTTVRRIGRWVDMDNAYFTMNVEFMQSVWWVFSEMFKKGLIYEGYKVVPYSVGISTSLSNFEANLNYKQVQDPAITVSFPVNERAGVSILAWTTTPWTLPSNMGLAVGRDIDYVCVRVLKTDAKFILGEALVKNFFKEGEYEILETMKGAALLGLTYTPLFDYFAEKKKDGAFRVIESDHVTTDSGTGVVHMAPAFGEEDYFACQKAGIPLVNPVDDDGMFTAPVTDYIGVRVKDADKDLMAKLKASGKLFKHDTITHSYPYCWRSDTPLIYRAVSSWFVAVEKVKDQLVANNKKTAWVPEHLRDGRFGNWLENARDWAISRNRFWGTPLPIWKNKEGEVICVSSRDELEKLTGEKVDDLHMEFLDKLTIPSPTGKSPLRRIDSVLDCWFESGSMPYAQWGYPFQNKDNFKNLFPAEFIAEGIDQTRGWFYTLMVIGTALFDEAPFRNVIVNGLILAEDGKKMSKSLKNYPDPMELLNQTGADALRLYLIDSPAVRAQELKFSEKGVREIVRKILIRWWNAYSFFVSYGNIDDFRPKGDFEKTPNLLDKWILSRMNSLMKTAEQEMAAYRLYNVVPALVQFVEDLTNTYIRFNRSHFWRDGMPEDKRYAYETLYEVLMQFSKVMAPFAPFLSEEIYLNLSRVHGSKKESVHLESYPVANASLINPSLEAAIERMSTLVVLGRNFREKIKVKSKIPLLSAKIIHRDQSALDALKKVEDYFKEELNIEKFEYETKEDLFVTVSAKANFISLGKRLGPKMKAVSGAILKLTLADILKLEAGETLTVEGEAIVLSDVEIRRSPKNEKSQIQIHQLISIEIDPTVTERQVREGLAREVVRKVQQARKNAKLNLDDRITLELALSSDLKTAVETHRDMLLSETLCKDLKIGDEGAEVNGSHTEIPEMEEGSLKIGLKRV